MGGTRTAEEDALFKQGLGGLASLYSHQYTTVFRSTAMPDDYPAAYALPEGANAASYAERGWCFAESSWASMTKPGTLSLDLGSLPPTAAAKGFIVHSCTKAGGRRPPLMPLRFQELLAAKTFTNGKEDRALVAWLYTESFTAQFEQVRELVYAGLGWAAAESASLGSLLASGALPNLERLNVFGNQLGDDGAAALATALRQSPGALPKLRVLELGGNGIGDAGMMALASVLRDCPEALPTVQHVDAGANPGSDAPIHDALARRSSSRV